MTAGGLLIQFKEAVAAAAVLGVPPPFLERAAQRLAQRNQQAAVALQAVAEAGPFSQDAYASCLQRAQQFGLHADAARAQRGLQLRRHRAAGSLAQLAGAGKAAEVETACQEAVLLGLAAEAEAAQARLEQRRAAATEELRQAALAGFLQQYQAAVAQAAGLKVGAAAQQACQEQLQQRQQNAELQLQQVAASSYLAAVRRHCQAALALGLQAAVGAAERQVHRRRQEAASQLAASTRAACEFVVWHSSTARGNAAAAGGSTCPDQLAGWLSTAAQLAAAVAERGATAALQHPPAPCSAWPPELHGWLLEGQRAAGLELEQPVQAAVGTLVAQLEVQVAAAQLTVIPLQQLRTPGSSRQLEQQQELQQRRQRQGLSGDCGKHQHVLCSLQEWRAGQRDVLPFVAGAAVRAGAEEAPADDQDEAPCQCQCQPAAKHADGTGQVASGGGGGGSSSSSGCCGTLDLSMQGLDSLELLAGSSSLTSVNLAANAITRWGHIPETEPKLAPETKLAARYLHRLADGCKKGCYPYLMAPPSTTHKAMSLPLLCCSLEALSALAGLRELRASSNQLASLHGIQPLSRLTLLDASANQLDSLPSLAALTALRQLDLSANRLTSAALAAAELGGCAACLTSLRLGGNQLTDLASWIGVLPSLLHLDVSGNAIASLAALETAAPLLQV
jgi:Leucine-rich repeat (LRR) protein